MALQKAESLVTTMLSDTILALCRNTLPYEGEICVEGLLGITLDNKEIFLVNINEKIHREGFEAEEKKDKGKRSVSDSEGNESSSGGDSDSDSHHSSKRKRKRKRRKSKGSEEGESNNKVTPGGELERQSYDEDPDHVGNHDLDHDSSHSRLSEDVKRETVNIEEEEEDDDEVTFVKEEPRDHSINPSCIYSAEGPYPMPHSRDNSLPYHPPTDIPLGQLQELAFQISADSSFPGTMPSPGHMVRLNDQLISTGLKSIQTETFVVVSVEPCNYYVNI